MRGCFITATDTGAGKTCAALGLMAAWQQVGVSCVGIKPVATGAMWQQGRQVNADALALQAQGSVTLVYDVINPYVYEPPIAPHLAAAQVGERIELQRIQEIVRMAGAQTESVVVEGVGGWRVPLNAEESVADCACRLALPVVLVVGMRLGCINHARLSVEAILADDVELAGWIAVYTEDRMLAAQKVKTTLEQTLGVPLLAEIPYLPDYLSQPSSLAQYCISAIQLL